MDVAVALTLVQTVLQLLDSHIWMELESLLSVEDHLGKLRATMSTINAVLLDADEQERLMQYCRSHVEHVWLERLKEVVYVADDLFDKVATLAHCKKLKQGENLGNKQLCWFFSSSKQFFSVFSLSREVEKVRKMLDDIVKDHHHDFILRNPARVETNVLRKNLRESHSFVCEEDMIVGRDDDKRIIVNMLLENNVVEDVSLVSIVGIGGLGKTVLAQLVYNDEKIEREFQLKMWVCVSEDFNVKVILGKILAAATKQPIREGLTMELLQMNLRQELDGKKYLLVLDDIWNKDFNEWLKLRNLLIRGGRGSRILVTTRSREVAKIVGSQKTHELKGLSEEDSWVLFERMTLEHGQHQLKAHLAEIGKEILQKCANVPLSIRVVGSLLRGKEESRWRVFRNTDLADIKKGQNGISSVLKISYYDLPFHLKSCFSYCAIFPKDYRINKEDLIYLWMAQGFIIPLDGESFEDAGEEYFADLLQRCFFQDVERNDDGGIISCKMHDLIHDLAKEVAGVEILSSNCNTGCFSDKTLHIFIDSAVSNVGSCFARMKRLRTILQPSSSRVCSYGQLPTVRYLRVLDLHNTSLKKLPSTISEFVHLRYLDLSGNVDISVLPTSTTELYNLQTLKLRGCRRLKKLPRDLSKLVNLRHLDTYGCSSLTHMPPGMKNMASLCKLTQFVIGDTKSGAGGLTDLKYLTNLTGSMEIKLRRGFRYNAPEVGDGGYLINKPHLRGINIYWNVMPGHEEYYRYSGDDREGIDEQALLQGLQPHYNLRVFELWCYPGARLPNWEGSLMNFETCLPNLVQIRIVGCKRLEYLPRLSQLRHLKVLQLGGLKKLEYVENSSSGGGAYMGSGESPHGITSELVFFPSLEKLELNWLTELKGWWKTSALSTLGDGEIKLANGDHLLQRQKQLLIPRLQSYSFPKLSYMKIGGCPNLETFPLCPKLETLEMRGFNEAVGAIIGVSADASQPSSYKLDSYVDSPIMPYSWPKKHGGRPRRLQNIEMDTLGYLDFLPEESIPRLSHLVMQCDLDIERLTAREVFRSCRLSSLRSLVINRYWKLKSLSGRGVWEHLNSLQSLRLSSLYELE